MLAPSPDWFTGINAVDMCEDGYWVATKTISAVPRTMRAWTRASFSVAVTPRRP